MRFCWIFFLISLAYAKKTAYLITCGPGEELYSTFGHSALWVYDSLSGIDEVYNFGTFDFETEGFYWKFIRGKLPYALDYSSADSFVNAYIHENRSVWLQELLLDSSKVELIHLLLKENAKEENKNYAYDFFFDNCSTRLRDLLEKSHGNDLRWSSECNNPLTLRQLLNPGVKNMPWTKWGFYLGLGSVTDKVASTREVMFLPDHLKNAIANATTTSGNKLAKPAYLVFKSSNEDQVKSNSWFSPLVILFLVFLVYLLLILFKCNLKWIAVYESILLIISCMLGCFILFLWLGTDHQATKWNYNVLWASPLSLFILFTRNSGLKRLFYYLIMASNVGMYFVMVLGIQEFSVVSVVFSVLIFLICLRRLNVLKLGFK